MVKCRNCGFVYLPQQNGEVKSCIMCSPKSRKKNPEILKKLYIHKFEKLINRIRQEKQKNEIIKVSRTGRKFNYYKAEKHDFSKGEFWNRDARRYENPLVIMHLKQLLSDISRLEGWEDLDFWAIYDSDLTYGENRQKIIDTYASYETKIKLGLIDVELEEEDTKPNGKLL